MVWGSVSMNVTLFFDIWNTNMVWAMGRSLVPMNGSFFSDCQYGIRDQFPLIKYLLNTRIYTDIVYGGYVSMDATFSLTANLVWYEGHNVTLI